ncbi:MAG: hypothetical protein ACRDQ4_26085 [Pseudonocardiaceae bacterium]
MSVISVEIRGLRRDAMSAAGFRHAFRSGLNLLVVSALATLAVLLGMTLTDDSAAATSTPLLASIMHAFVPTTHVPTPQIFMGLAEHPRVDETGCVVR